MQPLVGCDFTSSPSRRKPIVVAHGEFRAGRVWLLSLRHLDSLAAFAAWIREGQAWIGGFDLPFGLPRALVEALGWPVDWEACICYYASLSRSDIRAQFSAYCDDRPVGRKFAHRATDLIAKSSSSMKWVNPPVAYMLHAGVPLLLNAGVHFPGIHADSAQVAKELPKRVALEAYPGMLAREILGNRSYKSDHKAKQTGERLIARKDLLTSLEMGHTHLNLSLKLTHAQREALIDDPTGDTLDAVLCLIQAAWGQQQYLQGSERFGLPFTMDPLEGWILSA